MKGCFWKFWPDLNRIFLKFTKRSFFSLYYLCSEYLLGTNPFSPAVPLCAFGPVMDPDCTNPLSCCSHTFKGELINSWTYPDFKYFCGLRFFPASKSTDGTPEKYFVFALPDSVLEPSLLSAAASSGHNASCSLQRLTSDLGFYIVPLDGCGVNKHVRLSGCLASVDGHQNWGLRAFFSFLLTLSEFCHPGCCCSLTIGSASHLMVFGFSALTAQFLPLWQSSESSLFLVISASRQKLAVFSEAVYVFPHYR